MSQCPSPLAGLHNGTSQLIWTGSPKSRSGLNKTAKGLSSHVSKQDVMFSEGGHQNVLARLTASFLMTQTMQTLIMVEPDELQPMSTQ